jgi:hypothetical protein
MKITKLLVRFGALAALTAALAAAGDKKKSADSETVIAGSVFRDPGYAMPEATVTLVRKDDPKHKKLAEIPTTFRGEFVFHVPLTPAVYVVKASAKGYRPEEKEASVTSSTTALDRIELTFTLESEKK